MTAFSYLSKWFDSARNRTAAARRPGRRPGSRLAIEELESRNLLSGFGVTITGVPTSAQSPEGTSLTLGSNVTNAPSGDTFSYSWKITDNGSTYASGTSSSLSFTPETRGTYTANLSVTDANGTLVKTSQAISVYAVPPKVTVNATYEAAAQSSLTLSATATDPSTTETAAGFSYVWYFGDGTYTTGATPTHTYANPGTYIARVYAIDREDMVGDAATTVTVTPAITATLNAPPSVTAGTTNAAVTFVNVTGGTGGYTYSFDFGNTGTFEVSHSSTPSAIVPESYLDAGPSTLVVRGRVTDSNGDYHDFTTKISITDVAPTPQFTVPSTIKAGSALTYTGSATDPSSADTAAGFTYSWNFGDGTPAATGATATHTYPQAGTYTITLSATDEHGATGKTSQMVTVLPALGATFKGPSTVTAGTTTAQVSFTNPVGGTAPYTYSYDFNDSGSFEITGSTSPSAMIPETYVDSGPATLTVHGRITDSTGAYVDYTTAITITDVAPTPTITPPNTLTSGTAASFVATATDPSTADTAAGFTYTWTFGDGTSPVTGATPSHTYSKAGTYTVTLSALDTHGATGSASTTIVVGSAGAGAIQQGGFETPIVNLGNFAYNPAGSAWTFTGLAGISGNSSGFTRDNPVAPEGAQVAFVQDTGSFSQSDTLPAGSYSITFQAAQRANLTSSQTVEVLVDGSSVGTFTPGATSYASYATSIFTVAAGSHTFEFLGLNPNGEDNTAFVDAVTLVAESSGDPTATFSGPSSVSAGATTAEVHFTNPTGGTAPYTFSYDFGNTGTFEITNSISSTATIPESYVDAPGTLVVHGRITDSNGHYSDYTTNITINDIAPTPTITPPSAAYAGIAATFTASATDPSQAETTAGFTYTWNFGDGNAATGANVNHTYASVGTYTVTLSAADAAGGVGTTSISVTVGTEPNTLQQGGFETPSLGDGYSYDPTGTAWTFNGDAGITANANAFTGGNPDAPEGVQVAFLQQTGSFSQSVNLTAGNYAITFWAAQRANVPSTQTIQVLVDGTPVDEITPTGTSYSGFSTTSFALSDGSHTIEFLGLNPLGGDNTVFVDAVTLVTASNGPPTATLSAPSSVSAGTTTARVSFANLTGGSGGYTYSYDFGNTGTFEITNTNPTVTIPEAYVDVGATTLAIHGRITDSEGQYTDYLASVSVTDVAPIATFTSSIIANVGQPVTLALTNPTDPSTAETADGFHYSIAQSEVNLASTYATAGTASSTTITFNGVGSYTVYGRILDVNNAYTDYTTQVTAVNPGKLSVSVQTSAANPGTAVTLLANATAAAPGPATYIWNFGDGNTQSTTAPLVSHSYASIGSYITTVTVIDSAFNEGTGTGTVTVTSSALQDVTLDGTSFALAGSPVSFSVSNPNQPPSGGFTYTWNFGDGARDVTNVPIDTHTYTAAGSYIPTVVVTDGNGDQGVSSAAVTVSSTSDSTDPLFTPVVNSASFTYLGSFALPENTGPSSDPAMNDWDTAYSYGGLTYRYVNGQLQFFTTAHVYSGGDVYSFTYPGVSTNQSALPQAQVITNWGDIYSGQKEFGGNNSLNAADVYGLYYDQSSGRLYWTYGNYYNTQYQYNPSIGYSTLDDATGVATGAGAWSLANRPEKFDRGGILQIPSWFANQYTGGDTLGVGFGGYYSIVGTASFGPALAAIAPPNPSINADDSALPNVPLLGYPENAPDRAHRDTNYTSYYDGGTYPTTTGQWNPANGTGYWSWSDVVFDSATWIDTPQMQGVLVIAKVGQGNVYYQDSERHASSGQYLWMVYNPADLAAVASGAKQQWQIQPEYEWSTPTLPFGAFDQANGTAFSGNGYSQIGGVVFDPTTNRLYVLQEGVLSNTLESWPEMYVYQVGPPNASLADSMVVGDGSPGFSTSGTGWGSTLANGYYGEAMQTISAPTSADTASWSVTGLAAGYYTLAVDWNEIPNNNTTAAVYSVYDGSTLVATVTVNQNQSPMGTVAGGPVFQSLGSFNITSGNLTVVVAAATPGALAVDALMLSPTSAS